MTQQSIDQKKQFLVLGFQLRHDLPQHPLQSRRIIRQGVEIDLHVSSVNCPVASLLMTPA